ncbi:pectate lyase family protein [Virgisporangium aurantiacum]|uniref:Pectate lyase domain-containing protein n=1 Tax=Virgisporangium aurantiacum TaxID=175570 RepID=A0A8J4DY57_9ACTN|nr:right-handed parallel beta-helix repeat-containing protein [Virgisporangium aurantiacum]GIJ54564.1 hypothetical protein Vau01_020800 [Virgisporangium aurantiacum]
MNAPPRRRRLVAIGAATLAGAVIASLTLFNNPAQAETLFSDNFEDGNNSGWSSSGGSWAVASDGSNVDRQSNAGSERARHFAGQTSWTNYVVQARVKANSLASNGVVGLLARASSSTKWYRLALLPGNQVALQAQNGSSVTTLGSVSTTVSTGTWYTLRLTVNGSTISGTVNGTSVGSATNTAGSAGRVGFYTEFAAASFDDITVDTVGSGQPTDPPTSNPPSNPPGSSQPPTGPAPTGLVGWATQGGGTTGGGNASSVTVTSSSALTSAIAGTNASVVRISGTISCSGMLRVGSNKSILGGTLVGCGLNVANASNVIIRNVTFRDWNDDAINVQYSTRVWIDHNSLSNGYDGAIDIKRSSDFVTVSWNRIFDHDKSMLLGHDDGNGGEDIGHLRVTYHHNWFDGTNQRHPRVRFGNPVHVYNNYYGGVSSYGVASTEGAGVLVEGNYFENTEDPYHLGEGDSGPGTLVARNNCFVNSGSGQAGGSVASIPYSYTLDTACNVKSIVTANAGAGRISV